MRKTMVLFMGEYRPPFTITNEILSYVSSISEKIGRITATSNLEAKPHLKKNNRIKSIHFLNNGVCMEIIKRTGFTYRKTYEIVIK